MIKECRGYVPSVLKEDEKKMKKILSVVLAAVTALSIATGCGKIMEIKEIAENSDVESLVSAGQDVIDEITVAVPTKDRAGNDIKVPENVEKIVSMAPSTTQVLVELGLGDKIVGIDTNSAVFADKLPSGVAQFDMMAPDNEAIAALSPDLVFTSGMSSVGGTSPFQSLVDSGVCVADIPTPSSIEGICNDIEFIGSCVGKGYEALAYSKGLTVFMQGIEEQGKTVPEGEQKTVLVMMNVPDAEYPTIYTFGKDTYMNEMIEMLGAKNAFGEKSGWLAVSVEEAIAANPDVILMDCNWLPGAADQVKALEGWEEVKAIKDGAVYQIDEDLCSRPNHHVGEATLEWGKYIYADKFGNYTQSFDELKDEFIEKVVG